MCVSGANCGAAMFGEVTTRTCDPCPYGCSDCSSVTTCTDCFSGFSMGDDDLCKGCDSTC